MIIKNIFLSFNGCILDTPICVCSRALETDEAERVVPGKHKKMGWGKLGGRWKKGWDTGTSTVPWFVGVQKVNT